MTVAATPLEIATRFHFWTGAEKRFHIFLLCASWQCEALIKANRYISCYCSHREEPLLLIPALFCTWPWPWSIMKVRRNFPCSEKTAGVHLLSCTIFNPINSFSHYISYQALQLWCTLKFLLHRESALCSSMSATPSDTCDVPPALALYQGV